MDNYKVKYTLEGLDKLDIDNLNSGRLTKEAMRLAANRARKLCNFNDLNNLGRNCEFASREDRILADEINDMFEAARQFDNRK